MLARLVLALCLLALAAAAPAGATTLQTVEPLLYSGISGPRLNGDRVVWASGDARNTWTISASAEGSAPTVLATSPVASPDGVESVRHRIDLAASPDALAYRDVALASYSSKYMEYGAIFDLVRGMTGAGGVTTIASCDTSYPTGWPFAVSGTRVAMVAPCGPRTIVVHDLAGAVADQRVALTPGPDDPGIPDGVALAGDQLAWQTVTTTPDGQESAIIVVDLVTGKRRVAWLRPVRSALVFGWDLRDDGVIVVASGRDTGTAVDEFQRIGVDGIGHRIPVDLAPGPIRLAGDRVAALVGSDRSARHPARFARTTLALVSLDGQIQPVARFGPSTSAFGAFGSSASHVDDLDFDGRRLAWSQSRCAIGSIHVVDVATVTQPAPVDAARPCPEPEVLTRQATVSRSGVVRIRVRCRYACADGVLSLRIGGRRAALVRFTVPAGGERTLPLHLSRDAVHAGRAVVRLYATMQYARYHRTSVVRLRWR